MFKINEKKPKTPERRNRRSSSVFIANFAHIVHLFLVFLLLKDLLGGAVEVESKNFESQTYKIISTKSFSFYTNSISNLLNEQLMTTEQLSNMLK